MTDFFELIKCRETCRNYASGNTVDRILLEKCLDAARLAPSACNSQPWSFIAVTDKTIIPSLRECIQENGSNTFASDVNTFIVVCEEVAVLVSKTEGFIKSQKYAQYDVGQAVAYFTLAACELGLSTSILGRINEEKIKSVLGLDSERRVRLVIAVGYAANDSIREKKRRELCKIADFR